MNLLIKLEGGKYAGGNLPYYFIYASKSTPNNYYYSAPIIFIVNILGLIECTNSIEFKIAKPEIFITAV